MSKKLSAAAREHVQNILPEAVNADRPTAAQKPPQKQVCNLQEDSEIMALLQETSQHDDLCKLNDMEFMDKYFNHAAAKESSM